MTENYDLDRSRASGNSKNYFEQPSSSVLGPYLLGVYYSYDYAER